MAIQAIFQGARKKKTDWHQGQVGGWMVLHGQNDAIFAYCDSEREADQVIIALNATAMKLETGRW